MGIETVISEEGNKIIFSYDLGYVHLLPEDISCNNPLVKPLYKKIAEELKKRNYVGENNEILRKFNVTQQLKMERGKNYTFTIYVEAES